MTPVPPSPNTPEGADATVLDLGKSRTLDPAVWHRHRLTRALTWPGEPAPPSPKSVRPPPPKQVACERCKRRKAKCDRHLPRCHRCEEAGVQCEYANRRRPPGFPSGHRHVLESKISKLEADLARLKSAAAGAEGNTSQTSPLEPPEASRTEFVTHISESVEPPASQQLARSPVSGTELAATSVRTGRIKERKPPADLVYSLSSLYFRHVHHWLPFLDARHVFADFATSDEPSLAAYALFGAALPFSKDSRLTQESKDSFWKYSKRHILVEALEEPSYVSLEALTVLVLDLSGMTNGPQVWGVLAVAIKLALQLENITGRTLRTSTSAPESGIRPEQTAVRRLFWAVYALDCYISITTRHASELTDQHTQYLLSIRDSIWKPSDSFTGSRFLGHSPSSQGSVSLTLTPHMVFSYQLELLDISRRLHGLYLEYCSCSSNEGATLTTRWLQSVMGCSGGLNAWYTDLSAGLRINSTGSEQDGARASPMAVMLNAYYHGLTIYLHGLLDFSHQQGLEAQLSNYRQDNRASCINSVEALSKLGSSYLGPLGDKMGWPFAWASWVAARYCLVSEYYGRPLPQERLTQLIRDLGRLGEYWQISGHYLRLILSARDELHAMAAHTSGLETENHQLLHAMVDWRVAACDLEDQARVDPLLPGSFLPPVVDRTGLYDLDMLMQDSELGENLQGGGSQEMIGARTPGGWFAPPTYHEASGQYLAPDQGMHGY